MANITLKGIPPDLHRALKRRAEAHNRSLNKEVIAALRSITGVEGPVPVEKILNQARETRKLFKGATTLRQIQAFKIAGRE